MKLGLGSYAYRWAIGIKDKVPDTPLSPQALVETTARHELKLLQIADNMPLLNASTHTLNTLKAAATQHNIELELGTDGVSNGNLRAYLRIAQHLNAKLVRVTLNQQDLNLDRPQLIKHLQQLAADYQQANVSIAIENHFLLTSDKLISIIKNINAPNVGVCLDVANSIASKEWPETTISTLAPYALNLHLKDYQTKIDPYGVGLSISGSPLGEGELDIQNVFTHLKQHNKNINIILEHWLPPTPQKLEFEDTWTQQSIRTARAFIAAYETQT